ncbi:MAG: hypothetical protein EOO59_06140, partial [Hymenobacter sp.]
MTTFRWYLLGILVLFGGYVALEYYRPKPLDWSPTLSNKDKIPYGTYVVYDALPQVLGTDSVVGVRVPIYNQLLGVEAPEGRISRRYYATDTDNVPETAADTVAAAPADTTATASAADSTATELADQDEESEDDASVAPVRLPLLTTRANYLFINQEFSASRLETEALLRFVEAGHDVFIAAEDFGPERRGFLADTLGFRAYEADTTRLARLARRATQPAGPADSVRLHLL